MLPICDVCGKSKYPNNYVGDALNSCQCVSNLSVNTYYTTTTQGIGTYLLLKELVELLKEDIQLRKNGL